MRNSIIFVLVTFGGIIAIGLTANAIKKSRTSSSCWVQGEQGLVETQCPTLTSPPEKEGEGLTGDKSLSGDVPHKVWGDPPRMHSPGCMAMCASNPRECIC